jgi:ArsR family transcriptional regulator, arsenate/arsenite/antimonite-responsive transcriptional repressor
MIETNMGAREVQLDDRQFIQISKALAEPKRFEILQRIGQSKEASTCSCVVDWIGIAPATVPITSNNWTRRA